MMQKYALIVAGGSGTRMQNDIQLIVVLPQNQFQVWEDLKTFHNFQIPHQVVAGGKERVDSVRNGLQMIDNEASIVAIHDGVRPLVSLEIIEKSFAEAETKSNAITAVKLKDSIRQKQNDTTIAVDRNQYFLIQTPQTFQTHLIKKAYQQTDIQLLTDDASVAEKAGYDIHLIDGDYRNLKITTQEDLIVAEAFLSLA
jgi:2-C-methyl-D-erythritol 4-phosphate cytidylyltransferase